MFGNNIIAIVITEKTMCMRPGLPRLVFPAFQPVIVVSIGGMYTQGAKQMAINNKATTIDN